MSLGRPKPPTKRCSAPDEEDLANKYTKLFQKFVNATNFETL